MPSLAKSPLAPVLGQRVPLRGPARLLFTSYARTHHQPPLSVTRATTKSGDVFHADLSSTLEWQLWAFGCYEPHFAELFSLLVHPGDWCVDVGANVGVHTVRLAKLAGRDGGVIAVEPDPEIMRRAERNVALNGLSNVRFVNAAAGDRPGEMRLYRPGARDANRARASLLHHAYLTGVPATVPVVTLDDICRGQRVALIKIDVEGLEGCVVQGAAATISAHAPSIIFEYAPELLEGGSRSPFEWLAGQGYEMFNVRARRHRITGRVCLALDRVAGLRAQAGNVLAVSPAAIAENGSLTRLRAL